MRSTKTFGMSLVGADLSTNQLLKFEKKEMSILCTRAKIPMVDPKEYLDAAERREGEEEVVCAHGTPR